MRVFLRVCRPNLPHSILHQIGMSRLQKSYKTFVVQATAIPLREPEDSFTVHVDIRKDNGSHSDMTHFESGQVFPSENAALAAGFKIGKQKIDAISNPA